jgi:hypothetical protein
VNTKNRKKRVVPLRFGLRDCEERKKTGLEFAMMLYVPKFLATITKSFPSTVRS